MWQLGDECKYFFWFDEGESTKQQKRALIETRDEIQEKNRVIEQLNKTISEMKRNFEKKETVNDENEDEIVTKFEIFIFNCFGLSQRCKHNLKEFSNILCLSFFGLSQR